MGGSFPVPPTPPVIRVVLLRTEQIVQRHFHSTVLYIGRLDERLVFKNTKYVLKFENSIEFLLSVFL